MISAQRFRPFWNLLAVCAALASASASAAVFRCERNGAVTFTDQACDAQAQALGVAQPSTIAASPAPDLARAYDRRMQDQLSASAAADAQWQRDQAGRAQQERIHKALMDDRVVAGMTAPQVRQVWGEPGEVQTRQDRRAARERWVYLGLADGSPGRRTVSFDNGQVSSVASQPQRVGGRRISAKSAKPS